MHVFCYMCIYDLQLSDTNHQKRSENYKSCNIMGFFYQQNISSNGKVIFSKLKKKIFSLEFNIPVKIRDNVLTRK